jgi:hypothetical protein
MTERTDAEPHVFLSLPHPLTRVAGSIADAARPALRPLYRTSSVLLVESG